METLAKFWHERKKCILSRAAFQVHTWIIVGHIVGFVLITNTIVNVRLILCMIRSRKRVMSGTQAILNGNENTRSRRRCRDRKCAMSAIGIGLVAFVCKITIGVCTIILHLFDINTQVYTMVYNFCFLLVVVESGSSFFVNAYLNSMFRNELTSVFCCKQASASNNSQNSNCLAKCKKSNPEPDE